MALFRKITGAENVFLRMGLYGRAGSGKTRTATDMAIGLSLDLGDSKPIAFVDSEGNGVDHMAPIVEAAGLELQGVKTRDFGTLLEAMREAQGFASVIIIDSATHFWEAVRDQYMAETRKKFLDISDWGPIKRQWRNFTELFLTSQAHTIVCGRSGFVYESEKNDRGKWEFHAVDTKMKAEGELEHEPSLLLEMTLVKAADGPGYINRATVLKDRTDQLNGREIDFPRYGDFAPVIKRLSPGREHVALDRSERTRELFGSPDWQRSRDKIRKEELVDRLKSLLDLRGLGGQSAEVKTKRAQLLMQCFGTPSAKEAFGRQSVPELEHAMGLIEVALLGEQQTTIGAGSGADAEPVDVEL